MRAAPLARAALGLYPAAWRARYGDEVRALLDDSGAGLRTVASLAWHAAPAWVCPARQLHDRAGRMRASLATVLLAWTMLAGLAAVFVQLAQGQPAMQRLTLARHPLIQWSYWAFDAAIGLSVLAVVAGGLPLWLAMLRQARGEHRRRETAWLLAPLLVPAGYLIAALITVGLVSQSGGQAGQGPVGPRQVTSVFDLANGMTGPWWLLALILAGFAAGGVAAAGPGLALRGLAPGGRAVRLATAAAGLATVTAVLAGAASIVALIGLYQWAPPYAGYHQAWPLGIYLPLVLLAAVVAMVSASRGVRAARRPAAGRLRAG